MRACWILVPILLTGCATHRRAHRVPPEPARPIAAIPERPATRLVETRYEVRGYHDAADAFVRHEAHAIYRATRVPVRPDGAADVLATVPRRTFPPASFAPLPPDAEMSAELTTQKQITGELRAIHAAMSVTQKEAQLKFGELVNQTAETMELRRALEEERARVSQLEATLREESSESVPASTAVADMKW